MKPVLMKSSLLALGVLVCLAFSALITDGLPSQAREVVYYDDASFSNMVGESVLSCNSGSTSWGQTTPHFAELTYNCNPRGGYLCECKSGEFYVSCPVGVCVPGGDL